MFMPESWAFTGLTGKDLLLFAAGFILILFFPPVCELKKRFRPTWSNAILAAALIVISMFFFVKYSPFIYFNF
jgi:predicted PurR-regulated permease PerM